MDPIFSTPEFKAGTKGVPGTAIRSNDERRALQAWLDCTSGEGEWRWQPTHEGPEPRAMTVHKQGPLEAKCERAFYERRDAGNRSRDGWDVRPSLKFGWHPSSRCEALRPRKLATNPRLSRRALCGALAHKNTLLVGDVSQYGLHDLLLDWTSTKQASCAGNLYCKIHPICSDYLDSRWAGNSTQLEAGELDAHVYFKIPPQPFHQTDNFISNKTLLLGDPRPPPIVSPPTYPTGSHTFLRYRRSDSLWGSSSPTDARFQPIWLHPNNGIRDINNFWYGDVRKSDLIILSRRPLGLPRRSQMSRAFVHNKHLPSHHLEYLRKHSRSTEVWGTGREFIAKEGSDGVAAAVSLIGMAIKMVLEIWLPEVLFTLSQLQKSHGRAERLIVWRGEWRVHGDCVGAGVADRARSETGFDWERWWDGQPSTSGDGHRPHPRPPGLFSLLFPSRPATSPATENGSEKRASSGWKAADLQLDSPRLVFHNLQTIFQNRLMSKLGPAFGIPFLDLESQASVWRTGLVGSSTLSAAHGHPRGPADCFDYCFPSPGLTLEESFLGGLLRILHVSGSNNSTG
ncbi:hypothetical protein PtB15_9B323 [Puccinia triticina]|nr:hypothetical protein PtB15_9B323 [Puccinia triticina]